MRKRGLSTLIVLQNGICSLLLALRLFGFTDKLENTRMTKTATATEFQQLINDYGRRWTVEGGRHDLSSLDVFYAPDADIVIWDMAGLKGARGWAEQKRFVEREFFSQLVSSCYVPRQDVEVKLVGAGVAVTAFIFDIESTTQGGQMTKHTGRQTNVWERRGDRWVIVHEHGSIPLAEMH